jgi:SAM-dependent methyltransferase
MNNEKTMLWAQKIYTPDNGYVKENVLGDAKVLDVGCGGKKIPGADGIDSLSFPEVNIVHDLDSFPWPIKDNTYDVVSSSHFLEHSRDVVKVMEEVHRILKPGGRHIINVPHFRCIDAFVDPTHESFFESRSMDYFCESGGKLSGYSYSPKKYKKIAFWYGWPHKSKNPLKELFKRFVHKHPYFYDQYLSLLLPVKCVMWELEVIK